MGVYNLTDLPIHIWWMFAR